MDYSGIYFKLVYIVYELINKQLNHINWKQYFVANEMELYRLLDTVRCIMDFMA